MAEVNKAEQKSEDIVTAVKTGQKALEELTKAELLEYTRATQRDAWYQRMIRPGVTIIVVLTFCAIVLHGSIWCGDRSAFEAILMAFSTVVGFWFAGREMQKVSAK